MLRTVCTEETNGITSLLRTSVRGEDGLPAQVERGIGDLHIGEAHSGLTIYVPKDKTKQNICFATPLPIALGEWLMQDSLTNIRDPCDSKMITVLTALLNADNAIMEQILDYHGIFQLSIQNEDVYTSDG